MVEGRQKPTLPRPSVRQDWPYVYAILHLVLALIAPVFYLLSRIFGGVGANIGGAVAQYWTAVFGLPWSLFFWPPLSGTNEDALEVIYTLCNLLNVAIVTGLLRYRWSRS